MKVDVIPKRNFLTLLVAYFAVQALFSVLGLLVNCNWLPSFDITINGYERSLTIYVLTALSTILYIAIFVRMISQKSYGLTSRSKVGLVFMSIQLFGSGIPDILLLNLSSDASSASSFTMVVAAISGGLYILYIIGIFMFIGGSPASRKLKIFVKCIPFFWMLFNYGIGVMGIALTDGCNLMRVCIELVIFMIVYRMARNSLHAVEQTHMPVI